MAVRALTSCVWMLVLGACVSVVHGAECGRECALCVYRLLGQNAGLNALTCSLECDGGLDGQKLRLCRDFLLEEENRDPQQEAAGVDGNDNDAAATPEHLLAKKYGGFMKRYGGFMSRRSPDGGLEEPGNPDGEENVRLEILKILNAAAEHGGGGEGDAQGDAQGDEAAAAAVKRYGGFMRRAEGGAAVQGDLLEAVLGRGLKKRYGGFMRRVGRPEWLVDGTKSNDGAGGALKGAWDAGSPLQKRYGGFMD